MGLADAIQKATVQHGPKCSMRSVLGRLQPDDLAALLAAFADDRVPSSAIAEALTAEGLKVSQFVVRRHRAGTCACGTS